MKDNNIYMEVGRQTGRLKVRVISPGRVLRSCVLQSLALFIPSGKFYCEIILFGVYDCLILEKISSFLITFVICK